MTYLSKGYLELPYLQFPYLTAVNGEISGLQVQFKVTKPKATGVEVVFTLPNNASQAHTQFEGRITRGKSLGIQFAPIRSAVTGTQITYALYNTTNLRILYEFSSRGSKEANGQNWSASSTAPGDFSVSNLNTDIPEQVWRSAAGVKTGIILQCDSGVTQGVYVDTFAMLSHNLTTSADLILQGSETSDFSAVGFDQVVSVTKKDSFWVSQSLPQKAYRYWRLQISDPTNSNDHLEVGCVLFGKAVIFQGDNIVDEVTRTTKHYADKIETEGFTNVTVDRAVKTSVGLEMKNWAYGNGNYDRMKEFFDACRTGLKALWIPTPQFPERFAVFGKMTAIPAEKHNVKGSDADYIDFSVEVDESL
ncbi:hypothetical protein EBX31_06150 [bacterium]|nr:hypothetical protein [bacterium]